MTSPHHRPTSDTNSVARCSSREPPSLEVIVMAAIAAFALSVMCYSTPTLTGICFNGFLEGFPSSGSWRRTVVSSINQRSFPLCCRDRSKRRHSFADRERMRRCGAAAAPQSRVDDYRRRASDCGRSVVRASSGSRRRRLTTGRRRRHEYATASIATSSDTGHCAGVTRDRPVGSGQPVDSAVAWKTRALRSAATEPSSRARLPHHLDGADAAHRTHRHRRPCSRTRDHENDFDDPLRH